MGFVQCPGKIELAVWQQRDEPSEGGDLPPSTPIQVLGSPARDISEDHLKYIILRL